MDALVTDSRARNFVKYCIAVRSCTEGLILFILKQCEEQFTRNVQYIKSVNGNEHAEQCNALHERIQSKHVHKQPTWNNADWSVPFNRSWQHMKCYITDSGYLETTSPQEAGLKALVQICYNHLDLQNSFGQQVTNLFKIEQTHDTIFKSESWLITDAALGTYVLDIQHVLTHVHQNLNSDVNAQLNIMQKLISDEIPVTVIDEIYARQHAVSTLNRFLISLDGTISNPQISDEIRTKKAELLVVKDIHARKRDELIRDADAKLDLLKQSWQTKENELLKIKAEIANEIPHNPIGNCVRANVDLQANTSHQTYATFLQEKIYDNSIETVCKQEQTENSIKIVGEGVLALSYNLSKVAEALGVQGLHLGELRMTANVLGTDNNDVLNRDIVNAGSECQNGVHLADRHGSQLQRSLQPVCEHLDNDGSSITRINYECVAFYIRCSTLHELNTLCEDFLTDKIQHLFQPLQDYLRTLPGCSNAYIVVNITERDFLKCIDPILRNVNHTLDLKSPVHSHISSKRVTPVASSSKLNGYNITCLPQTNLEDCVCPMDEHNSMKNKAKSSITADRLNNEIQNITFTDATEICTEKSETLAKEIQNNGANSLDTHHNKRTLNLYYYHCLQAICPWALGDTYERASEELVRRLEIFYSRNRFGNEMDHGNTEAVHDLYTAPLIYKITCDQNEFNANKLVNTYKTLFKSGERSYRRIFLQGEAGMGKTTFLAKLALDWCSEYTDCTNNQKKQNHQTCFTDVETLKEFYFVFFIALKESRKERALANMIQEQIIDLIYDSEEDRLNAYDLLLKIMRKEKCLVVQDGLDEWCDPYGILVLPKMITPCHSECTILTTTRPWKMSDTRISNSQIDCLLEHAGIREPFHLIQKVLVCFGSTGLNAQLEEFKRYVNANNLHHLCSKPGLLQYVAKLWMDGIHLQGSMCHIYSTLLDKLLKKASNTSGYFDQPPVVCFEGTQYLKPNLELVISLSKLAFAQLFSCEKESSLVFNDWQLGQYISQDKKVIALKAGLLMQRKLQTTLSFVHKTVQEFLAAFYIANNTQVIEDVIATYLKDYPEDCVEISQVFIFLCGLNVDSANTLLNSIEHYINPFDNGSIHHVDLSRLISAGFEEAVANRQTDICLEISDIDFDFLYDSNQDAKKNLLLMNKANIRSLKLHNVAALSLSYPYGLSAKVLQQILIDSKRCLIQLCMTDIEGDFGILDLSPCQNLRSIIITARHATNERAMVTLKSKALLNLTRLEHLILKCNCDGLDLRSCHNLETVYITGTVTLHPNTLNRLPKLRILLLDCPYSDLELTSSHIIETLDVGESVTLVGNELCKLNQLKHIKLMCKCDELDLSCYENLETVELTELVTVMPVRHALAKLKNLSLLCKYNGLDLSLFPNLETIVLGKHISLLPNKLRLLTKLKCLTLAGMLHVQNLIPLTEDTELYKAMSLPSTIEDVTLINVTVSASWHRCLISKLKSIERSARSVITDLYEIPGSEHEDVCISCVIPLSLNKSSKRPPNML